MSSMEKQLGLYLSELIGLEDKGGTEPAPAFSEDDGESPALSPHIIFENRERFTKLTGYVLSLFNKNPLLQDSAAVTGALVRIAVHNPMALTETFGEDDVDYADLIRTSVFRAEGDDRTARAQIVWDALLAVPHLGTQRPIYNEAVCERVGDDRSFARDENAASLVRAMNRLFFQGADHRAHTDIARMWGKEENLMFSWLEPETVACLQVWLDKIETRTAQQKDPDWRLLQNTRELSAAAGWLLRTAPMTPGDVIPEGQGPHVCAL